MLAIRNPKRNPTSSRWTKNEAQVVLASQKASGLSIFAFACREGLDPDRLYRWTKRLKQPHAEARTRKIRPAPFIEVRTPTRPTGIDVQLRGGHRLCVPPGFDADSLRQLILVLDGGEGC